MKQKHYIAIAQAIKENLMPIYKDIDCKIDHTFRVSRFVNALCVILAADNPKFDKSKFMEAIK